MDSQKNFYFSHMYNCIYDCAIASCKECILSQLFVVCQLRRLFTSISETIQNNAGSSLTFFSGYDCDSLAFEKITSFAQHTLSFFKKHPEVEFELRTKSVNIETLLGLKPSQLRCSFSLSPERWLTFLIRKRQE